MDSFHPIGVFDSGFGGLTVLREIERLLPMYDFLYLGDNARAPYGNRSFESVHAYTLEAVQWLFGQGCHLIILACNTASAKALRTIQQDDLPRIAPDRRVLGVIRPVTERIGTLTASGHVGILGTAGTVESRSYVIEIEKYFPEVIVTQEACPMWVPLVENGEADREGADYFVKQHIDRLCNADPLIDAIVLGCTHYPLLERKIGTFLHRCITIVSQGAIVAESLGHYFARHTEIEGRCSRRGRRIFYTSEKAHIFERLAAVFYGREIKCREMRFS
ncbi:MAG: glutamate racemase [Chitinispirillaceae bacterium]|nr:glutamate racemase [Chitinispirillaceae bacterium]